MEASHMLGEPEVVMQRKRREVWALRAIALIISLMLWVTVLGGRKTEITKRVQLDYQIPKGLVVANQVPQEITFRVSGPRAFLKEFIDKSVSIPIDLSSSRRGDYEISLREDMLDVPLGVRVISVSQSTIPIRLDRVTQKRVPIRASFSGLLPDDLKLKSVTLQPSTVEVEGAAARLAALDAVQTDPVSLSLESIKDTQIVQLNLTELPGVTVRDNDKSVKVSIEVSGQLDRKWIRKLDVIVKQAGQSRGGKINNLKVTPPQVNLLVEGPAKIVSQLAPADFEVWAEIPVGQRGELEAKLIWTLPPGVRIVKRSADSVRISLP
jgi:YbbR domain-containing protein